MCARWCDNKGKQAALSGIGVNEQHMCILFCSVMNKNIPGDITWRHVVFYSGRNPQLLRTKTCGTSGTCFPDLKSPLWTDRYLCVFGGVCLLCQKHTHTLLFNASDRLQLTCSSVQSLPPQGGSPLTDVSHISPFSHENLQEIDGPRCVFFYFIN